MFGYVTPYEPEMKVKEQGLYKSIYCGLCRAMGKRICPESRLTLSYDIVFLALVRMLLEEQEVTFSRIRCAVSVNKKRTVADSCPVLEYCGAAGAILAYHNIADDARDKHGVKRIGAKLLLRSALRMRKRAALPELDACIEKRLSELDREEDLDSCTVDSCADIFGELLAEVFAYGYEGDRRLIAREIGYHAGRWIYILDAADDFYDDKKSGEFNPLTELDTESLICSLNLELEGVSRAVSLITPYDGGIMGIVENIIYIGMPEKAKGVLKSAEEKLGNARDNSVESTKKGKSE